ncbi:polysaccharide biosynthesis/export family protein [Zunongwangia atlantica]|uniref:Periplasmic protein involved in polysaccharide export n=1 Tax=Zunongwangia atlantica 22II14-10F7 TaxID=1185767 RepID=A0A1Y1SY76_9FLAO|nr:polysaccharide biosynthesis/export family protein [Zunongwangia atlantica]ORL43721.1 periplasmic protein involved in polysaccharide export [Zunongwangia atlantica 22II14-10F7]
MSKPKFIFSLFLLALLSSCVSREEMVYFHNLEQFEGMENVSNFDNLEIKPNDQLIITVSAKEAEAAVPFNLPFVGRSLGSQNGLQVGGTPSFQNYLVNAEGEIQFPVLGTIRVAGMNRKELSQHFENLISDYVKDPIVNVKISNFQVTVLGEVRQPGTFPIQDEYLSLPKALGLAGDLTVYGKRKNILIVRETENGEKRHAYLDLTDANIVNSPFYYLQQNDIVYVEPNGPQIQSSSYNRNASVYISIASVLVSVAILLTR